MSLFKVSKTARAMHLGTYHYDLIHAKYEKERAGSGYHIYVKYTQPYNKTQWQKVM